MASDEVHERRIRAADGWELSVLDLRPPAREARGLVIAGHAMMVDRRTLYRGERPSLVRALLDHGVRVLLPDLRGHGESGPRAAAGGRWGYDAIVDDTGVLVELARGLAGGAPIGLIGHSLFAHTSLAWLAMHPDAPIAAHVGLAMDIWSPRREPSWTRRLLKRALIAGTSRVAARAGYLPVRRLRIGSNDEALLYWRSSTAWIASGRWTSLDGAHDYEALLPRIRAPFLHVVSEGDRLYASPASALRLSAGIPRREVWHLGHPSAPAGLRALAPTHMGIVTDPASGPLWEAIAGWLGRRFEGG
ncbi:MAG: alpha/beta fold hydrolase [Myxococcales bacterium]|nr:alpha/beta fold hydrolase [Myxococcales bacterium]